MTSDLYSKHCLIGNWYEERLAPNQPFREKNPEFTVFIKIFNLF